MKSTITRTTRLGAVAILSLAGLAASATAASASTTVRYYTNTAGTTSALLSGNVNGTLTGSASLTAAGSGGGTASCTTGNLIGSVGSPNPSTTSVPLTPSAFNLSTCTDTIPAFNITGASLSTPGTGSINYNQAAAPQGTLNLSNPVIHVAITSGGQPGTCAVRPIGGTATATLTNPTPGSGSTDGTLRFISVPVEAVATSGICANALNTTTTTKSRFTATFNDVSRGTTAAGEAAFITP